MKESARSKDGYLLNPGDKVRFPVRNSYRIGRVVYHSGSGMIRVISGGDVFDVLVSAVTLYEKTGGTLPLNFPNYEFTFAGATVPVKTEKKPEEKFDHVAFMAKAENWLLHSANPSFKNVFEHKSPFGWAVCKFEERLVTFVFAYYKEVLFIGQAICNPTDTYDRLEGIKTALDRLIKRVNAAKAAKLKREVKPIKPKIGQEFWWVNKSGSACRQVFSGLFAQITLSLAGLCFASEEDARASRDKVLDRYKQVNSIK